MRQVVRRHGALGAVGLRLLWTCGVVMRWVGRGTLLSAVEAPLIHEKLMAQDGSHASLIPGSVPCHVNGNGINGIAWGRRGSRGK